MLPITRTGILGCFLVLLVGCAQFDMPQQPRFENAEGAGRVIVRSHRSFLLPSPLVLSQGSDRIGLQALPEVTGKWAHRDLSPDDTVHVQLHDTLLGFLAPSCEVPF
jgi:hypothetical protein